MAYACGGSNPPAAPIGNTMICNNFIKELNIKINLDLLREISLSSKQMPNGNPHQRLVSDNSYLSKIKEKFPCFSPVYNILLLKENREIPIHIDADRYCALNIPLLNVENSSTIFYNFDDEAITEYDKVRIAHIVKSNVTECFRFTLTHPTLINNGDPLHPHGVIHTGSGDRVILSWSFLKSVTFESACKMFNDDVVSGIEL